ncbi:hypothetical protein Tco_0971133 [Tanacetum coccineum]
MSKVLQERGFRSLPNSTEINPRDHVKLISTTVEADMTPIRRIGSSQYAVSAQQSSKLIFETRQVTIPFSRRLNDYYCDDKANTAYWGVSLGMRAKFMINIIYISKIIISSYLRIVIFMDTAYGRRWIRRIENCEYAFSCEDLALIRRISFLGYGVLVRNE